MGRRENEFLMQWNLEEEFLTFVGKEKYSFLIILMKLLKIETVLLDPNVIISNC